MVNQLLNIDITLDILVFRLLYASSFHILLYILKILLLDKDFSWV